MELLDASEEARFFHFTQVYLTFPKDVKTRYWSVLMIVLHWINIIFRKLKTFDKNRKA